MTKLQDRLKAVRKKRSLTQGELANYIGLSTSTISAIEIGRIAPEDTLKSIALALDLNIEWFLTGIGEPPPGVIVQEEKENVSENPYRDFAIKKLEIENEKLWNLVQKLTGAQVGSNFKKSPKPASAKLRVLHVGAHLGDQLRKVA